MFASLWIVIPKWLRVRLLYYVYLLEYCLYRYGYMYLDQISIFRRIYALVRCITRLVLGGQSQLFRILHLHLLSTKGSFSHMSPNLLAWLEHNLLHSSTLLFVNQQLQSIAQSKGSPGKKAIEDVIPSLLDQIYARKAFSQTISLFSYFSPSCFKDSLRSSLSSIATIHCQEQELLSLTSQPVAPTDEKLKLLWEGYMGKSSTHEDVNWELLGFQNKKDPSTDFRAMGQLALRHLLFFVQEYPQEARHIRFYANETFIYPFALVGITISKHICTLIKDRSYRWVIYEESCKLEEPKSSPKNIYDLLFCHIFENFHIEWLRVPNRDVMQFNIFFDEFVRNPAILRESNADFMDSSSVDLESILAGLHSKNEASRLKFIDILFRHISYVSKELFGESYEKYMVRVAATISQLVCSHDSNEKITGIMAIERLLDIEEEPGHKIHRYADLLKLALPSTDPHLSLIASKVFGKLVKQGGSAAVDLVESEITRAVDFVRHEKNDNRRHGAILIIDELIINVPTLILEFLPDIFDCVWKTIFDGRNAIRLVAANIYAHAIVLVSTQGNSLLSKAAIQAQAVQEIHKGFKSRTVEGIHGAVLLSYELFSMKDPSLKSEYASLLKYCLKNKDHKDLGIKKKIIEVIPIFCSFDVQTFIAFHAQAWFSHLIYVIRKEKDKIAALESSSKLFSILGSHALPFAELYITVLSDLFLKSSKSMKSQTEFAILDCVSAMVTSLNGSLAPQSSMLIELLFSRQLSRQLFKALTDLTNCIPQCQNAVQDRLLNSISRILFGKPFASLCSSSLQDCQPETRDYATIELSIEILGRFYFGQHDLSSILWKCAESYLYHDQFVVRLAAAIAICQLLLRELSYRDRDVLFLHLASKVLEKLLHVAISDTKAEIRMTIIKVINSRLFDAFLVYPSNIQILLLALNDENFDIQNEVARVLGRLSLQNPSCILPPFRRALLLILNSIKISTNLETKKNSAKLLAVIVQASHRLIFPYVEAIFSTLMIPLVAETDEIVVTNILFSLGELFNINAHKLDHHISELFPLLIRVAQDPISSTKKEAGIIVMTQLIRNTGYVIEPLLDYPELLNIITDILSVESKTSVRRAAVKFLGTIGAVDPYKLKDKSNINTSATELFKGKKVSTSVSGGSDGFEKTSNEYCTFYGDYEPPPTVIPEDPYAMTAVSALLDILRDQTLNIYHVTAIQSIVSIMKFLGGQKSAPLLAKVVPVMKSLMMHSPASLIEYYFQQLSILVYLSQHYMRFYLPDLTQIILAAWGEDSSSNAGAWQLNSAPVPGLANPLLVSVSLSSLRKAILLTLHALIRIFNGELRPHLVEIFPKILSLLNELTFSDDFELFVRILVFFSDCACIFGEYIHLILPSISKIMLQDGLSTDYKYSCLEFYSLLCKKNGPNLEDHASKIVPPLLKLLQSPIPDLRHKTLETLTYLAYVLKKVYLPYINIVSKIIGHYRLSHKPYEAVVKALLDHQTVIFEPSEFGVETFLVEDQFILKNAISTQPKNNLWRLAVNQHVVRKAWSLFSFPSGDSTDKWTDWLRRLNVELLRESPYNSLRVCSSIGAIYNPLAKKLFNESFVAIWTELITEYQADFLQVLDLLFESENSQSDVVQAILGLAEYYEHIEKDIPFSLSKLADFAYKHGLFAKSLRYKEQELLKIPEHGLSNDLLNYDYVKHHHVSRAVESLISINSELQIPDAAVGVLKHAQEKYSISLQENWYEKLQRWDDALFSYEKKLEKLESDNSVFEIAQSVEAFDINSERSSYMSSKSNANKSYESKNECSVNDMKTQLKIGIMRCLYSLGDCDKLASLAADLWPNVDDQLKGVISSLSCTAAWGIGAWDLLEMFLSCTKPDSPDGAFFRAIMAVHRNNQREATIFVDKAREMLDKELTPLLSESYARAYTNVVRSQMLSEVEEILELKNVFILKPDKKDVILQCWNKRLLHCERSIDIWQRFIRLRSLFIPIQDDVEILNKFGNLCRKQNRPFLAEKVFAQLLGKDMNFEIDDDFYNKNPEVSYSYLKLLWSRKEGLTAYSALGKLIQNLILEVDMSGTQSNIPLQYSEHSKLLSKFLLRYAAWKKLLSAIEMEQDKGGDYSLGDREQVINEIIQNNFLATRYDPTLYKAWHKWAISNFEAITFYEKELPQHTTKNRKQLLSLQGYIVSAVQGFLKSIALSKGATIQDTLRLLTLWFKYGSDPDVLAVLQDGLPSVPVETWLQVIPQLIARIYASNPQIRRLIHTLLLEIGKEHPQAIIYSLAVASKSVSPVRQNATISILDKLKLFAPKLVDQALIVSQELIRVAILWHEMWHSALEEASRLYYGQKNIPGMFEVLEPLHQMVNEGPETLREISFHQNFSKDLEEAYRLGQSYKQSGNVEELQMAWDLYYQIFKKISKLLQQITVIELQYSSPKLLAAQDLDLAVPGTYKAGEPIIRIKSFNPVLHLINSKQRPRKLLILGDDGKEYPYLLKGHEDLRQDERVMQLFGLVNSLLADDRETFSRHLNIQKYPVIPLSPNSGLIGWIPHCDTLHTLIRDYRESHGIPLNVEHRLMLQLAPDYDHLSSLQKIEAFKFSLDHSSGNDLAQILWLRSSNSESWLERRSNYTKSLAVMSMVGYILGLGDRHPSNLMISRDSGRVIHIDFGDCFEVAMHRDKFPEKIPFRLTRMLVKAMEVSGIEGTFRIACEHTLRVLLDNRDSLMAVLEAFVYDPLISWRLLAASSSAVKRSRPSMATTSPFPKAESSARFTSPIAELAALRRKNADDSGLEEADLDDPEAVSVKETLNTKALTIISRVSNKLTGRDFQSKDALDLKDQVERLIIEATSIDNLCQCYIGWYAYPKRSYLLCSKF